MKRLLSLLLAALLLTACGGGNAVQSESSRPSQPGPVEEEAPALPPESPAQESSLPAGTESPEAEAPEKEPFRPVSEETRDWVGYYLSWLCMTEFDSPEEIPPEALYSYAFAALYREADLARRGTGSGISGVEGDCFLIPKATADAFLLEHFGLGEVPYQGTSPYDPERDAYLYYFAQGVPQVRIAVRDYSLSPEGLLTYRLAVEVEDSAGELLEAFPLECRFQLLTGETGYSLRAVSLKRLAEDS